MNWKQYKNRCINYASLQYFPSYKVVFAAQALGEIVMMSMYLIVFSGCFLMDFSSCPWNKLQRTSRFLSTSFFYCIWLGLMPRKLFLQYLTCFVGKQAIFNDIVEQLKRLWLFNSRSWTVCSLFLKERNEIFFMQGNLV